MAAERKRTRKRALVLLLITFIAAAATYFYITQEAKADKAKAIIARIKAEEKRDAAFKDQQIAEDKTRVLQDSINKLDNVIKGKSDFIRQLKDEEIIKEDPPGNYVVDTAAVNKMIRELDSMANVKRDIEQALKAEHSRLNLTLNEKIKELKRLQIDNSGKEAALVQRQKEVEQLKMDIRRLYSELQSIDSRYAPLKKDNDALKAEIQRNRKTIDSLMRLTGNANLIGKLYYQSEDTSRVRPSNIPVYLIAKARNRQLVKNISVYEISCYEKELNAAKGSYKTVTDANGNYAFRNIPEGEYLLKICTYYGGFYTVRITDPKKRLEKNFNASPPVRFPYSN